MSDTTAAVAEALRAIAADLADTADAHSRTRHERPYRLAASAVLEHLARLDDPDRAQQGLRLTVAAAIRADITEALAQPLRATSEQAARVETHVRAMVRRYATGLARRIEEGSRPITPGGAA